MSQRGEDHAILQLSSSKSYHSTLAENKSINDAVPDQGGNIAGAAMETATYHRRWYVLVVFLVTGVMQGWMWNTFAPIAVAMQYIDWPLSYISAVIVVLCISSTIGAPLCAWIMDRKGLRLAMIFATLTLAIGCSIRCFTAQSPTFFILNILAFAIDGLGGTVPLSAASALSSVWFPPKQRAFATAICVESTNVGSAMAFLIGPAMVTTRVPVLESVVNGTDVYLDEEIQWTIRDEIMKIMYMQCGIAVLLLILVLCYFPKKPPKPPSISAFCEREQFGKGIKEALKSWKLWLLFLPYGTGCGIYFGWSAVYDILLQPVGYSEAEAGWVSFYGNSCGIIAAVLVSLFAGFFQHHLKKIVLVLLVITVGAVLLFICTTMGFMPFSAVALYVSALVAGAVLYAVVPLCFELACEVIYPVSENIVCLVLQWWNNFFVILFFVLFLIPTTQRTWMNWLVLVSTGLSAVSFAFLPEIYGRLSVDETKECAQPNVSEKQNKQNGATSEH